MFLILLPRFSVQFHRYEGKLWGRILLWMPGIFPTIVDFPDEVNVLEGEWPWSGKMPPLNMVHYLPAFPHQLSPWWDGSWQAHVEGRSTLRRQRGASAPLESLSLLPLPLSQCHMGKTWLLFLFSSEKARTRESKANSITILQHRKFSLFLDLNKHISSYLLLIQIVHNQKALVCVWKASFVEIYHLTWRDRSFFSLLLPFINFWPSLC